GSRNLHAYKRSNTLRRNTALPMQRKRPLTRRIRLLDKGRVQKTLSPLIIPINDRKLEKSLVLSVTCTLSSTLTSNLSSLTLTTRTSLASGVTCNIGACQLHAKLSPVRPPACGEPKRRWRNRI